MKGYNLWHYRPYRQLGKQIEATMPFIAHIAPNEARVQVEWFDHGFHGDHTLFYKRYHSKDEYTPVPLHQHQVEITGLIDDQDYEMYIARNGQEGRSALRLFRTGFVPCDSVVQYLHPLDDQFIFSGRYLASPSIARLPSGRLVVSMDVFAGQMPQNLTLLFCSDDNGKSWHYLNDLFPCFWGKLFVHREKLYMLAHAAEYGDILIGCSEDEGVSWTAPTVIFRGSGMFNASGPHKAPMPVIEHKGRLFTAIDFGSWSIDGGHASGMLSIDADQDLLVAGNWTISDSFLAYNPEWPGAIDGNSSGALEGNMVVSPQGELINMMRYQMKQGVPNHGMALQLLADADHPQRPLEFLRFVQMNGGSDSKFHLLQDPVTKKYFAICSEYTPGGKPGMRSVLSLAVSDDLIRWHIAKRLLDYRDCSPSEVGFQYCDFIMVEEDIYFVCRTAFNFAHNFHDANYITFHVIKNFRSLL